MSPPAATLVDTHALFWHLTASPRLGANAAAVIAAAEQGTGTLVLPSIVLAELYYLNEKLGRPLGMADVLARLAGAGCYQFVGFEGSDVLLFDALAAVPEMHDRIIVGVAVARGIPCLTRDASIVNSGLVQIIW